MPGSLIEGHAKLEKTCTKCHQSFSKKLQTRLCLECHDKVAADIDKGVGFHGRREDISAKTCKHCHTDHVGRDADIVELDAETFDHAFTDFPLEGRHRSVACSACHAPKKGKTRILYREAPGECRRCHKKDDPHKGRLEKCDSCHSAAGWRKIGSFDHDKTKFNHDKTKFKLRGAHEKVACKACHIGEVYKDLSGQCKACHGAQDVHKGRLGAKCETCHSPDKDKKWKAVRFDHGKDAKFPLLGKHAKTKCKACHKGDLYRDKLSPDCVACHGKDDPHKGQLGRDCKKCHKPVGWLEALVFDHDITRFPLIGLHAAVSCEECHLTPSFKDAPADCFSCHGKGDFHEGRLGRACDLCHNPNGWPLWRFDHARQARYPLTGTHKGLDCHACHTQKWVQKVRLRTACTTCHATDDVHEGAFGRNCERCHTTDSFSGARLHR